MKLHEEVLRKAGLDRHVKLESVLSGKAPGNGLHLSRRQQEIVVFMHDVSMKKGFIKPEEPAASQHVVTEVTQTLGRNPIGADFDPCICSKSFFWSYTLGRVLFPPEMLALQGIVNDVNTFFTRLELEDFSWSDIVSFAGNVFAGHHIFQLIPAVLCSYDMFQFDANDDVFAAD